MLYIYFRFYIYLYITAWVLPRALSARESCFMTGLEQWSVRFPTAPEGSATPFSLRSLRCSNVICFSLRSTHFSLCTSAHSTQDVAAEHESTETQRRQRDNTHTLCHDRNDADREDRRSPEEADSRRQLLTALAASHHRSIARFSPAPCISNTVQTSPPGEPWQRYIMASLGDCCVKVALR